MTKDNFYKKYNHKSIQDAGSSTSREFDMLARNMKSALKDSMAGYGITIAAFSKNHYDVSGFFERNGLYIYFSWNCPRGNLPVNLDDSSAMYGFLYRTAENVNDYRGGFNNFCTWNELPECVSRLFVRQERIAS